MLDRLFNWAEKNPLKCCALLAAFFVFLWVFESSMEARSFNRITGKQVSTWDAMWVNLRVEYSPVSSNE